MKLSLYQIDAFANKIFEGNPAAVIPLDNWLPDKTMQSIAQENNLSETAFFCPSNNNYEIRWFTPNSEVELCGHATLASAYVLFDILNNKSTQITFESLPIPEPILKGIKDADFKYCTAVQGKTLPLSLPLLSE